MRIDRSRGCEIWVLVMLCRHTRPCVCVCVCVCVRVCMYVCMHACMCVLKRLTRQALEGGRQVGVRIRNGCVGMKIRWDGVSHYGCVDS